MEGQSKTSEAAQLLAQKSVRARRKKWGQREFVRRMREWGRLGGRPPKKGRRNANRRDNRTSRER
jgi:hypothetical protein